MRSVSEVLPCASETETTIHHYLKLKAYTAQPRALRRWIRQQRLKGVSYALYDLIYDLAILRRDCRARISVGYMATELACSRATIFRALRELETVGVIQRTSAGHDGAVAWTRLAIPSGLQDALEAAKDRSVKQEHRQAVKTVGKDSAASPTPAKNASNTGATPPCPAPARRDVENTRKREKTTPTLDNNPYDRRQEPEKWRQWQLAALATPRPEERAPVHCPSSPTRNTPTQSRGAARALPEHYWGVIRSAIEERGNRTGRRVSQLVSEVWYSATRGVQRDRPADRAIKAAASMIAAGRWTTPRGMKSVQA